MPRSSPGGAWAQVELTDALYPDKSHDLIWLLIRMVHELIKFLVELRFGQLIKSCFLLLTRLFKNVC